MTSDNRQFSALTLAALVVLSTVVGSFAFAGTAAAGNAKTVQDGKTYWKGQELTRSQNVSANETLEVKGSNSSYINQVKANSNGTVVFSTDNMAAGDYYLEDETNTVLAKFTIYEQTFNASVEPQKVVNDAQKGETTANFTFDSNRATYDAQVKAPNLSNDQLLSIFGSAVTEVNTSNGAIVVLKDVPSNVEGDFSGIDAGNYTVTFAVNDTTASQSVGVSVYKGGNTKATFTKSVYSVVEGDVGTFTVNLKNTQKANVTLGDGDMGYVANFTVHDNNGDGKVVVKFNTWAAGKSGYVPVATPSDSNDSVTVHDESTLSAPPLDQGTYDLSVKTPAGTETDIASIIIGERSTNALTTYVAPASYNGGDASKLTDRKEVAKGDKFIVEIDANGLSASMPDDVSASHFVNDSDDLGYYLTIEETEPGMNRDPKTLDVSKGTVVSAEDGKIVLAYDTNNFSLEAGNEYNVTFHVTDEYGYVADSSEEEQVSDNVQFVERKIDFPNKNQNGTLEYPNNTAAQVTADTTVAPGTEFTVVARMEGDQPFLKTKTTAVTDDGKVSVNFDFSTAQDGDQFTVQFRPMTGELPSVIEVADDTQSTESNNSTETNTTEVNNSTETETATPTPTETATPTETPTPEPTPTATPSPTESESASNNSSDSGAAATESSGQPGFGIAVALVALLGAALLAVRRE